ncbi:MAG: ankyrin repeat domain-containing protein [Alphaproteobacteria bacterium]
MMKRGLKITFLPLLGIPCLVIALFSTVWLWPMHAAVDAGITPVVWVLAKAGMADKAAGVKGSCTVPLQIAVRKGYISIIDILLDSNADILFKGCATSRGPDILSAAVDRPQVLEHLLAVRHIDPNIRAEGAEPPIFSTLWCHAGTGTVVGKPVAELNQQLLQSLKLLLDHGADTNVTTKDESTPLASAALSGCVDVVRELIARKADALAADLVLQKYFATIDDGTLPRKSPPEYLRMEGVKESIRLIKRAAGK